MKNSTRYVLIAICIIMILLAAGGVVWAFANKFSDKAYADIGDTVLFNQLVLNTYTHDYTLQRQLNTVITAQELQGNHKYYIRINIDFTQTSNSGGLVACDMQRTNSHTTLQQIHLFSTTDYTYDDIFVLTNSYTDMYINLYSTNNDNIVVSALCVDLTLMYGAGNEITVEECRSFFTEDYYAYNPGTPMPLETDYLQGYQNGIKDFQDSLTATFNNDVLGTMAFAANIANIESNIAYNTTYSYYAVEGIAGLHLGSTISTPIQFDIEFFLTNYEGGLYFVIFSYTNGNLIPLSIDEIQEGTADSNPYVKSNVVLSNIDTLYFGVFNSTQNFTNDTSVTGFFITSKLTIFNIDVAALITASIGQTKSLYAEGGVEYNKIYQLGYNEGITHGNATLETMDYIGAAFMGIGSILQIELLPGVPFSLFILLPLMFGLIGFVVKLSKGGS